MSDDSALKVSPLSASVGSGRSFYSAKVNEFLQTSSDAVIGRLSSRHVAFHASAEAEQVRAWASEIELLKLAFTEVGSQSADWWLLLEVPLLRLGKRIDAIVLLPGIVVVIEFKIGATSFDGNDRIQTERYTCCLRDFHEASQSRVVIPVLCAERARYVPRTFTIAPSSTEIRLVNGASIGVILSSISTHHDPAADYIDALSFDRSPYRPTPTIVEAAQALYAGHHIADIGRGDAADMELQQAGGLLQEIAAGAEARHHKTICFLTGAPGAGKTLLGLDLALKSRSGRRPAALLSGNRPLVHVLTEALAADSANRSGSTKAQAKYEADAAIQNLLGYLKEHTDGAEPPENVIVFDEAQRAWDEKVGEELMGRPNSEPELFLNILDRLDWSCLVCLVGPGQEINRGEGGLALWGQALARAQVRGISWQIIAAPQALDGGPDVAGAGLLSGALLDPGTIRREPRLHLSNAVRSYRNPLHGRWVAALLEGDINAAGAVARQMKEPPAYLTRSLNVAKAWLRERRAGGRSVGLLASSGAVRLLGDGIPPTLRSNELGPIGHWFLKPYTDFRSAGALEVPMSEFGCQGLELDYVGLCWGNDLIWSDEKWKPRKMAAPRWQTIRDPAKASFRMNGYRVLLTRARAGSIIYVPTGTEDDPTVPPSDFDGVAELLVTAGCIPV